MVILDPKPSNKTGKPNQCEIHRYPEPDGGYSVYVPELPGVNIEGQTTAQAIPTIQEALRGASLPYREASRSVPWPKLVDPLADGETRTWATCAI